jgi:hypothetical protein
LAGMLGCTGATDLCLLVDIVRAAVGTEAFRPVLRQDRGGHGHHVTRLVDREGPKPKDGSGVKSVDG